MEYIKKGGVNYEYYLEGDVKENLTSWIFYKYLPTENLIQI